MKQYLWYILPALAIVGLIGFVATRPQPGQMVDLQGNDHIAQIDSPHKAYNTKPPTSGPHVGNTARWGIHEAQIPDELQVHNLEDGGVIVHYDPEQVSDETVQELTQIVASSGEHLILEPYADMETAIALTAWGRIERLSEVDEERIRSFIEAYAGVDHHRG